MAEGDRRVPPGGARSDQSADPMHPGVVWWGRRREWTVDVGLNNRAVTMAKQE